MLCRDKLVQLVEEGELRIRDHRERNQAAIDSSASDSHDDEGSPVRKAQNSKTPQNSTLQNKGRKRCKDGELNDGSRNDEAGSPNRKFREETSSRPSKKARHSRQGQTSRPTTSPVPQSGRDNRGQTSWSSTKRSGMTRVRRLYVKDGQMRHGKDGVRRAYARSVAASNQESDLIDSSAPGGSKDTAICLSDDEAQSVSENMADERAGFGSSVDEELPALKEPDVDSKKGEEEEEEEKELVGPVNHLQKLREVVPMMSDPPYPPKSPEPAKQDKLAGERNVRGEKGAAYRVKPNDRKSARATTRGEQQPQQFRENFQLKADQPFVVKAVAGRNDGEHKNAMRGKDSGRRVQQRTP